MRVSVLLFGPEAAAIGRSSVDVETRHPPTCADLREALAAQYPALRPSLASARFAVNSRFASPDLEVTPGDEVALIGLVSGG